LNGGEQRLDQFSGQVLLIVNTASKCGFTPQYAALESLYRKYRNRGFAVLGFPSNQFGAQEPGSADEIGPTAHPLYRFLKQEQPGIFGLFGSGAIRWNFTKFLIDRGGRVVARFGSATKPERLAAKIERLLGEAHGAFR